MNMNSSFLQNSWPEVKNIIKSKWAKFNDEDLETVKNDLTQLSVKLQTLYGYSKAKAEAEFAELQTRFRRASSS